VSELRDYSARYFEADQIPGQGGDRYTYHLHPKPGKCFVITAVGGVPAALVFVVAGDTDTQAIHRIRAVEDVAGAYREMSCMVPIGYRPGAVFEAD
jgi:hypothetical protein